MKANSTDRFEDPAQRDGPTGRNPFPRYRIYFPPLAEAGAVFIGIMVYIWFVRQNWPWAWVLLVGTVIVSHVLHRESLARLGFESSNLKESAVKLVPAAIAIAVSVVLCGVAFDSIRWLNGWYLVSRLASYLLWGFAQQYALNAYFGNRVALAFPSASSYKVAVYTGFIFAVAHSPNLFLMAVTFAGGTVAVLAYVRFRSIYVLAISHGIIGFVLTYSLPESITHHLRIGPGFYR